MRAKWILMAALALAGCSKSNEMQSRGTEKVAMMDVAVPTPETVGAPAPPGIVPPAPGAGPSDSIRVSVPQMAYVYRFGFTLPGPAIAKAQAAHVALCDRLGPARCQVLAMTSSSADDDSAQATLKLRVASVVARRFGAELERAIGQAGGRATQHSIEAEDVSKDIVDTTARLHQRELLVARLTEILRTRQGKVAELVEAERSVAAAQEEIDQARSWLTELQGRVAMSTIELSYAAVAPPTEHVGGGLSDSVAGSFSGFVLGIGAILQLVIYLLPWALLVGLGALIVHRFAPRWRRTRDIEREDATPPS